MSYSMAPCLTPTQLTDLLNYVIGLPRRGKVGQMLKPSINVFVVRTWDNAKKHTHYAVERWCDGELIEAGLFKATVKQGPNPRIPYRLQGVLRNFGARI